ncbi:MAG TPA: type II toxin-antitoxin system Phd/YefM family antitoxin [Gemmataceae bacterium]|nr:type II toxin-antitoxin system Phd/YefM family antitoxin [Gemmataceae bacterium]
MLIETDNLVSAEQFRKGLNKYLKAVNQGRGPIAVTRKSEVVGFLLGPQEYEALFGIAVRELSEARGNGPRLAMRKHATTSGACFAAANHEPQEAQARSLAGGGQGLVM